tara:strand:- start:4246 stop:4941 length:696 start_codon:yes stop_codon:yes gene_type:complete
MSARTPSAKSILIIDDDAALYETLSEQLSAQGEYVVNGAGDAASADRMLREGHFDLLLLDDGLPDMDGRQFCAKLREAGHHMPVIMLTGARDDDANPALEAGANDYVAKPFRFGALLARIRTQFRALEQSEDAVLQIGPYAFRPSAKTLTDAGDERIRLTEKEANILKYLFRAGTNVVSREELLAEVWGYNSGVTTHTLETHIYRLRQKIEADPSNAMMLVTDAGGYRLMP